MKYDARDISTDFPGYTEQDVYEQVRKMHIYIDRGLNPFTGLPYGFWEKNRYTVSDIETAEKEMYKYCIGI
jgi:hypothetical protein